MNKNFLNFTSSAVIVASIETSSFEVLLIHRVIFASLEYCWLIWRIFFEDLRDFSLFSTLLRLWLRGHFRYHDDFFLTDMFLIDSALIFVPYRPPLNETHLPKDILSKGTKNTGEEKSPKQRSRDIWVRNGLLCRRIYFKNGGPHA